MTLDRMNDLYKKGLYSPINYYLGLLAILKDGADVGVVMGRVPETLLGTILVIAARHRKSEDRTTDPEENTITGNIVAWGEISLARDSAEAEEHEPPIGGRRRPLEATG